MTFKVLTAKVLQTDRKSNLKGKENSLNLVNSVIKGSSCKKKHLKALVQKLNHVKKRSKRVLDL
jgi:methyl coenzyme M reductase subunit C